MSKSIKRKKIKHIQKTLFGIIIILIIAVVVLIKLYQSFTMDLLLDEIGKLEQKKQKLISDTEYLKGYLERQKNIDLISKKATAEFGLISNTDNVQVLKIDGLHKLERLKKQFANKNKEQAAYKLAGVR